MVEMQLMDYGRLARLCTDLGGNTTPDTAAYQYYLLSRLVK